MLYFVPLERMRMQISEECVYTGGCKSPDGKCVCMQISGEQTQVYAKPILKILQFVCTSMYVHTIMFTKGFGPVETAFSEIQSLIQVFTKHQLAGGVRLQGDMSYVDHEDATRIAIPCH